MPTPPATDEQPTPATDPTGLGHRRLAQASRSEDFLPSFSRSFLSFLAEIVKVVLISVAIIVPIRYFLIQPFYVKGASMEPTFHDNEYLIIDEISYRFREPRRGEVVVLRNPRGEKDFFIKRIIGLPGERVVIENGVVRIFNAEAPAGFVLNERTYLSPNVRTTHELDVSVGRSEYFILGDNRGSSLDSRSFGPAPRADIVGRTWIRAWPPQKLRLFSAPVYPRP